MRCSHTDREGAYVDLGGVRKGRRQTLYTVLFLLAFLVDQGPYDTVLCAVRCTVYCCPAKAWPVRCEIAGEG
jgi:hypothetical protein